MFELPLPPSFSLPEESPCFLDCDSALKAAAIGRVTRLHYNH
jgi:hypothetical protein